MSIQRWPSNNDPWAKSMLANGLAGTHGGGNKPFGIVLSIRQNSPGWVAELFLFLTSIKDADCDPVVEL
jgi:hypothetical protein